MNGYLQMGTRRFPLKDGVSFIGRDESCEIHLLDQGLSRQHAFVVKDGERYVILDFKSRNGIEVNGKRVEKASLNVGDVIVMGQHTFTFGKESPAAALHKEQSTVFSMLTQRIQVAPGDPAPQADAPPAGVQADTVKKLMMLYQVSKTISSELEIGKVLQIVMDKSLEVIKADRGLIALSDDKGELSVRASRSMGDLTPDGGLSMISRKIVQEAIESKKGVLTQDAMSDQRFDSSQSIQVMNIRSAMCVPLMARERLAGILYVDNRIHSESFQEGDLLFLTAFADQAAIAVENARLYATVQEETKRRTNLQRYFSPAVVEKILSTQEDIGHEKLSATVMFSDIRGFTSFSEGNSAEVVVGVLNDYLDRMSQVIRDHQGTVDKYLGDGIMAVFGAPFPLKDGPYAAVRAAFRMQQAMADLNAAWEAKGLPAQGIGIGIHTGELIAGNVGAKDRVDYTVIGDTVNTTSRLQGVAQAGEVILSQATHDAVRERVEVEPLEPVQVKGKREKLKVYKLTGLRE